MVYTRNGFKGKQPGGRNYYNIPLITTAIHVATDFTTHHLVEQVAIDVSSRVIAAIH